MKTRQADKAQLWLAMSLDNRTYNLVQSFIHVRSFMKTRQADKTGLLLAMSLDNMTDTCPRQAKAGRQGMWRVKS